MTLNAGRRSVLQSLKLGLAAVTFGLVSTGSRAAQTAATPDLATPGSGELTALIDRLARVPRRRDFTSVPMILTSPDQWDHEALNELLTYHGKMTVAWDNTDMAGPWLNLMRNTLNTQIWAYRNPNFLCVSATHGSAHLALYDQATWDKYQLSGFTGDKFKSNTLIEQPTVAVTDPADFENTGGVYSSADNAIPTLMRRGVVFLACHNAIAELADKLIKKGINPDKLTYEALVADLTNHLIHNVVLTPGVVGTLPLLADAGYRLVRS